MNLSNVFSRGIRWRICALLFFATTINYMDRQILGILALRLQKEIGWTEGQYGLIVASFTLAYAIGLLLIGRLLDHIGVRKGLAFAVSGWSLAAMGHALVSTWFGFGIARFFLGLSEAANFPAGLKAIAEWFPKKERSIATGIFNAGANLGVIGAAVTVPILCLHFGWRAAFIVQGAIGFIFLFLWLLFYRKPSQHKKISLAERNYIESDEPQAVEKTLPIKTLIKHKEVWAFAIAKFLTDPVWWFYLYWLPKYLATDYGITLSILALPLVVIYVIADIGSLSGGWLALYFIKRGKNYLEARRLALFICAVCILPSLLLPWVKDVWTAVLLVSLATACHQGWSSNLLNLPSDMFSQNSVASIVGFGSCFGCIGGILFQIAIGYLLEWNENNYAPLFIICGLAYISAWMFVRWLTTSQYQSRILTSSQLSINKLVDYKKNY